MRQWSSIQGWRGILTRLLVVMISLPVLAAGAFAEPASRDGVRVPRRPEGGPSLEVRQEAAAAAWPVGPAEEYRLGRAVAAQLLSLHPLWRNDPATRYVTQVGQVVVLASPRPKTYAGYHFAILDTPAVNAFACPGGLILVTRGLLHLAAGEDELAAILAHEVAHVAHRDGIRTIKRSRWAGVAATAGAERAASRGLDPAVVAHFKDCIDAIITTLTVQGYSQRAELAADQAARAMLTQVGYDPGALVTILAKIAAAGQGSFSRTHPPAALRQARLTDRLPGIPADQFQPVRQVRFAALQF